MKRYAKSMHLNSKTLIIILILLIGCSSSPRYATGSPRASAKKSKSTYLISIKTDGYQWLEGSAYWESPTLAKPTSKENKRALKEHLEGKSKQRQGV